jgi:hypothetical protein
MDDPTLNDLTVNDPTIDDLTIDNLTVGTWNRCWSLSKNIRDAMMLYDDQIPLTSLRLLLEKVLKRHGSSYQHYACNKFDNFKGVLMNS